MKIYFTFLCLLISSGLASASIQTAVSQDKPPHVYVKSYKMSDQASGTHHYEDSYYGYSQDQTLTCSGNFYGLMDGNNGLIGAGAADFEVDDIDSSGNHSTFKEHMFEQDTNSTPALVDWQYISDYYDGTTIMPGWSFPISQVHCDINVTINTFATSPDGSAYQTYAITGRRGAQAILKLQTGGKATSRLRNVIGLTGSATQATPAFPYITDFYWGGLWLLDYQHDHYDGTNIPSQNIAISSYGNLNSHGVLYKILPDNTEVDVTPRVNGSDYYTFNVTPQKYRSYFDLFVQQANPGYSLIFYSQTNDVGHAFWRFRTDAPADALQYISSSLTGFLGQKWGFYPLNGLFTVPGILQNDNSHSTNIVRTFYIGFPDLLQGLIYTRGISNAPPVYVLSAFNCVGAARGAGFAADVFGLPGDESPQNFGVTLIEMYPAPGQTIGPFIDTTDVFYSSAPY
jgi:hypothetical protein